MNILQLSPTSILVTHYCMNSVSCRVLRFLKPEVASYRLLTHRHGVHWKFFSIIPYVKSKYSPCVHNHPRYAVNQQIS